MSPTDLAEGDPPEVDPTYGDPMRSRRRVLLGIVAGVLAGTGAGLTAALRITSPRQAAAEAAPPPASALTAPVEQRVLTGTLVLRGTVRPARTVPVTAAVTDGMRAVVTRLPVAAGDPVEPGQPVTEVSGRPVFVLPGELPAYRDVRPGDRGPDVRQLQRALRQLGYAVDDADGQVGTGTQRALRTLYQRHGYDVPTGPVQPYLPAGEVVYVPSLPARVATVDARVGDIVTGTFLTLAVGDLVIDTTLDSTQTELVRAGQPVTILAEELGVTADGKVADVGTYRNAGAAPASDTGHPAPDQQPVAGAAAPAGYPLTVTGTKPLDRRLSGQDVRLTVQTSATKTPVLVVPSAAVHADTTGQTYLVRQRPNGDTDQIDVTVGASANGYVEIRSADSGGLAEGDLVVIGQ
jgi:peptidoglycan hydrolase-like protein with peptidoglycan-binding domain